MFYEWRITIKIVKLLGSHDAVQVPSAQGTCPACGANLFGVIRSYFPDGEPLEDTIHLGCVDCDAEIGGLLRNSLREWIVSNYRVKT